MHTIERILAYHFSDQHWHVAPPPAGVQKEAYIAQNDQHRLFVKFDAATPAWDRLAAIGVTPHVLATGIHQGRPYLIQQFVEGTYPDRVWFTQHIAVLAHFIRRYHYDQHLAELLSASPAQSYSDHIRQEVVTLEGAMTMASLAIFKTDQFHHAFDLFRAQAKQLQPVPLVPTHADPSPVNMLVTKQGLTMLDWEDVMLSDPMRDVGLVVWWYLPLRRWQTFFDMYGMPMDRNRIFWWVAKRSVELALWFDTRHVDEQAQAFLDDFYRAVQHQANPQVIA